MKRNKNRLKLGHNWGIKWSNKRKNKDKKDKEGNDKNDKEAAGQRFEIIGIGRNTERVTRQKSVQCKTGKLLNNDDVEQLCR